MLTFKYKVGDLVRVAPGPITEDAGGICTSAIDLRRGSTFKIERTIHGGDGKPWYELEGDGYCWRENLLTPADVASMTPAQLRAEADRIEAEEKRRAEREAKLSALTPAQRAAVDMLKAKPSAFGCNRADVIALASALCGVDLAPLVADG